MIASTSSLPWQAAASYDGLLGSPASALFSLGGSASPAADELDALGQSFDDEVSLLESQLTSAQPASSVTGVAQLLGSGGGSGGSSFDEQFLQDALPSAAYSSSGMLIADSGLFSQPQLNLLG